MKRFSLVLILLGTACSRTPPEPVPSPATATPLTVASGTHPTSTAGRCIVKLAEAPPKIPPAAMVCPPDPEPKLAKLPRGELSFPETPSIPAVNVEIANTRESVERGLMFRRSMAEGDGMVFKLESRREQVFWMQNTCIALDMLFIDDDGTIVGVVEGAEPLTETQRTVGCPSHYVLEMNGGWVRRHGVLPGQHVTLPASIR